MEFTLERYKCTPDFTLSRLYKAESRKLFVLDVVEPPVAGLSVRGIKALDPGRYKLFLKAYNEESTLIPVFQHVPQRERFSFDRLQESVTLDKIDFRSYNHISTALLPCGRIAENRLEPCRMNFSRFLFTCIISKQQKEIIWVNIK